MREDNGEGGFGKLLNDNGEGLWLSLVVSALEY